MIALKPCPFCGGTAEIIEADEAGDMAYPEVAVDAVMSEAADRIDTLEVALYNTWCALECAASVGRNGPRGPQYVRDVVLGAIEEYWPLLSARFAARREIRAGKCSTCGSPDPLRHPAAQLGGEVHLCANPFHIQPQWRDGGPCAKDTPA